MQRVKRKNGKFIVAWFDIEVIKKSTFKKFETASTFRQLEALTGLNERKISDLLKDNDEYKDPDGKFQINRVHIPNKYGK